ncbi:MAG TPA: DUF4412 domain-containing protein [Bacteroidales bacterium]|nr:DUF4412 domain-containing protein [Bacteroidales bacterium]
MSRQKVFFILLLILFYNCQSFAGWVITQKSFDSDQREETVIIETVFLQDNRMKIIKNDMITIFNLNDETITLMNPEKMVYWKGTISDYKTDIKKAMQSAMEEQLKKAPERQKQMIRNMYQGMIESIDDPSKFAGEEPDEYQLEIEKTDEKERFAGYQAIKYQIKVNKQLKEEAWLSESNRAHKEFDTHKFYSIFGNFISQGGTGAYYQNDEEYIEFAKLGFPLKSISYHGGYESISQVTNLERKILDKSDFTPPADYKKVQLTDVGIEEQE